MTQLQDAVRYRWADLPTDRPMQHLQRRRIIGEHAMISEVLLEEGCLVPTHAHENEQFAFVMRGRIRFGIGAVGSAERHDLVLEAGEVLHLQPGVPHSAVALLDSLIFEIFRTTRENTGIDRR